MPSAEMAADESLPAEVRALRESYDEVTREALSYLAANAWRGEGSTSVWRATDRALVCERAGVREVTSYVVLAAEVTEMEGELTYTLCLQTSERYALATLRVAPAGADGRPSTLALTSPLIEGGAALHAEPVVRELQIEGPTEQVLAVCGLNETEVADALRAWCQTHAPASQSIAWDHTLAGQLDQGHWSLGFALSGDAVSHVTLTFNVATRTITIEERG